MYRDLLAYMGQKIHIYVFNDTKSLKNKEAAILCRYISTGARIVVQLGASSLYPDKTAVIEKM